MFAMKRLLLSKEDQANKQNEVVLLESLTHPNIIKYYESFIHNNKLCIIMEYAHFGDMKQKIKQAVENN